MCGIAGLIGIEPSIARPIAERMRAALRHRGPDDEGLEVLTHGADKTSSATLVHTRLSIVELSANGHQPMLERSSGPLPANAVVFNGEIYHYRELWRDLEAAGLPCRTRADTEVILNAYRLWGTAAVERFAGMFAWCLIDSSKGTAWLCRDRLGMKPLYLFEPESGGLLFASELRALLEASEFIERKLDAPALESFLAQGAVMGEQSIVRGVRLLEPSESLTVDLRGKRLHSRRYWQLRFERREHGASPRDADASNVGRALRQSLDRMLLADVPVGVLLSSGVDSTAIATLATERAASPIRTVSVGFDVAGFDETADATAIARALGTDHTTVRLDGRTILADFETVLAAADQPTVDGFNTFYATRAAKGAGLKVALSGVGGDELFGGYASFAELPPALSVLRALGRGRARAVAARASKRLVRLVRGGRAALKLDEALSRVPELVTLYCLRRELLLPAERRSLRPLPSGSDTFTGLPTGLLEALRHQHERAAVRDRISHLELSVYMRHMLLRDSDVFSMAHPIELRLPLLEHPVVEAAAHAHPRYRGNDGRPKPLLVDAVGPRLPRAVLHGKKRGFTFPWDDWLRGPLQERARDALFERSTWQDIGLEPSSVAGLWERFSARDPSAPALAVLGLLVLQTFSLRHRLRA